MLQAERKTKKWVLLAPIYIFSATFEIDCQCYICVDQERFGSHRIYAVQTGNKREKHTSKSSRIGLDSERSRDPLCEFMS